MSELSNNIFLIWVSISVGALSSFIFLKVVRKKLPIAHSVAIIGLPKSGKTTLITSIFSEIFSQRLKGFQLTLRGEETINRVNEDIYRLEQDEKLRSTTDQDLFSYRAELISRKHIFTRNYKVEFGDFPGEDSEKLISDDIKWIQNLPYFNWVIDADSFIFIIDVSHAPSNEYRAKLTAAYRAAWQRLKDYHFSGTTQMHSKPVTIVFTKCDLLFGTFDFSENATVFEFDVEDKMQSIVKQYDELINYFKNESKKCNVIYSSSYVRDIDKGIKLGAKGILESVLP